MYKLPGSAVEAWCYALLAIGDVATSPMILAWAALPLWILLRVLYDTFDSSHISFRPILLENLLTDLCTAGPLFSKAR